MPTKRSEATPTTPPYHPIVKRDVEDTLSLYEFWANACNHDDNYAHVAVSGVNNLWQTVTSTVYCGNGQLRTVTKTVTARATATVTKKGGGSGSSSNHGSKPSCDAKCWSTYLWRKVYKIRLPSLLFILTHIDTYIDTYGYGISVAQGFTGIVMMLIGIYFLIFGFSSFRGTLAAVGFVFFALMTWIGLVNNEPMYGYPHNEIVYTCVSVGLGLVGAFLFIFLYGISIYFIGGLAGLFLAVFILSWKENLVIQLQIARICFIIGMGIIFVILIILAESYSVIFCTAFIGAFLFILGLDLFIHTGLINSFLSIFDGNRYHLNVYMIRTPVYIMLAFIIVLTLISFGWQYYWNVVKREKQFGVHIKEVKEPVEDEKKC
ncbi:uncharacterized protein BX663DRAFT_434048 [Cokeromyces recurvatus]|uniref:uncharacterized protein n=1 Tax=Cokeromyces recurvatus TaxID=90255 RepID=UPI00221F0381|nr:uncharacterized protein BX663DRAFT_434048 [Cokeromyces recurvatus]KAI7903373.1 hypothetical protein BX663DRAFT_434048 [Cokeromyces recurvatus]